MGEAEMMKFATPELMKLGFAGVVIVVSWFVVWVLWKENMRLHTAMGVQADTHAKELKTLNDAMLALTNTSVLTLATHSQSVATLSKTIEDNTKASDARLNALTNMATTLAVLVDRSDRLFDYISGKFGNRS